MRTATPSNIKTDFLDALRDFEDTFTAVTSAKLSQKSKILQAEFTFLGASILLEGFVSDLFIAYINKSNTAFVKHIENYLEIKPKEKADSIIVNATTEFSLM